MKLKNFILLKFVIYFIILVFNKYAFADPKKFIIVIVSQEGDYHEKQYIKFYNNVQQYTSHKDFTPIIYQSHVNFSNLGHWAIIPIIPELKKLHDVDTDWFMFCEDRTHIDFHKLFELLGNYNSNEKVWFGYALVDREPTIIHHFRFDENSDQLKYPNIASGFVMSTSLINSLANRIESNVDLINDFSIDAFYELALIIWNKGDGPKLIHEKSFCIYQNKNCTTYPLEFNQCGNFSKEDVYFAVKTTKKFHDNRINIIKNTWGRFAYHIGYFSETEDISIPTIKLNVQNTHEGHCSKTLAIIEYISNEVLNNNNNIKWILIADDDTILSVMRLQQFLTCYNSSTYVAIGQRYGYYLLNSEEFTGYNYITGGGGIVFSTSLIKLIATSDYCKCPSNSTPDDMFLGYCLIQNGIDVLHSSKFHQARPNDYPPEYLAFDKPISFHKHWMIDPIDVYKKWFLVEDIEYNITHLTNETHFERIKMLKKSKERSEL